MKRECVYQTQPWPSLPQQVVGTGILRFVVSFECSFVDNEGIELRNFRGKSFKVLFVKEELLSW